MEHHSYFVSVRFIGKIVRMYAVMGSEDGKMGRLGNGKLFSKLNCKTLVIIDIGPNIGVDLVYCYQSVVKLAEFRLFAIGLYH